MKKRIVSVLLMLAVSATTVFAANTYHKNINVEYGVTVASGGAPLAMTDVNGKTVNAFIYDGTTYVPLRAVSEELGASVSYDASANIVYLAEGSTGSESDADKIRAYFSLISMQERITRSGDAVDAYSNAARSITNLGIYNTATQEALDIAKNYYNTQTAGNGYILQMVKDTVEFSDSYKTDLQTIYTHFSDTLNRETEVYQALCDYAANSYIGYDKYYSTVASWVITQSTIRNDIYNFASGTFID